MGVNKVIYNGRVIIDLTLSTVTPATLLKGTIAFDASGNKIIGTLSVGDAYTNQVPISIDTSGNIYNGTGWKTQYRLSASSGGEREKNYGSITGFIPVAAGDIIRFKNTGEFGLWDEISHDDGNTTNSLVYYDTSFNWLGSIVPYQGVVYGICDLSRDVVTGTLKDGGVVSCSVPPNAKIGYVRISVLTELVAQNLKDFIVTVNEKITD